MHRNTLFWGLILTIGGVLLLLSNLGLLGGVNIWDLIWPFFLICLGIWILVERFIPPGRVDHVELPLDGIAQARLRLDHGAGRLSLSADAEAPMFLTGDCGGGVNIIQTRDGEKFKVSLSMPPQFWPGFWKSNSLDCNLRANGNIPLSLDVNTGAGEYRLNLEELKVVDLHLSTGASSTNLILSRQAGRTHAVVKAGVAAVNIRIPEGVAARIRSTSGLASIHVNRSRFPKREGYYQSEDYETAVNSVDLVIEAGVGSIDVH